MAIADLGGIRALAFDVFGTVVDWRTSVIRQRTEFGQRSGVDLDWHAFVDDWRYEGCVAAHESLRPTRAPGA